MLSYSACSVRVCVSYHVADPRQTGSSSHQYQSPAELNTPISRDTNMPLKPWRPPDTSALHTHTHMHTPYIKIIRSCFFVFMIKTHISVAFYGSSWNKLLKCFNEQRPQGDTKFSHHARLKNIKSPSSAGIIFKTIKQCCILAYYTVRGINIGTGTKIRSAGSGLVGERGAISHGAVILMNFK